jgi:hypothetical protein
MTNDIESIVDGFRRLALSQGLGKKSKTYKKARSEYIAEAVQGGFLAAFGSTVENLQAWKDLCWTVGVVNEESMNSLTSIKKCKAVSRRAGVEESAY